MRSIIRRLDQIMAVVVFLLPILLPAPGAAADTDFEAGSLIISVAAGDPDPSLVDACGLAHRLLVLGVPIAWGHGSGPVETMPAFYAEGEEIPTGRDLGDGGYDRTAFIIAAEDADRALPTIRNWLEIHPDTSIHRSLNPFAAPMRLTLHHPPDILVSLDGYEDDAFRLLNAAGIAMGNEEPWPAGRDHSGRYACPGEYCCSDCLPLMNAAGTSPSSQAKEADLLPVSGGPSIILTGKDAQDARIFFNRYFSAMPPSASGTIASAPRINESVGSAARDSGAGLSESTTYQANTIVIPMDTAFQDSGVFVAFGLMNDLLKAGIPVDWAIKPGKSYGDIDFTALNMVDIRSGSSIVTANYRGGPFIIDSTRYGVALPIVQAWLAKYAALAVHRATQSFTADMGRRLLAAPSLSLFADGNEDIAFGYLNAAALPQGILKTTRNGNRATVAATASAKPTVVAAPAGNNTVTGTSTEVPGSVIQVYVNGLYAGTTTVQPGTSPYPWSVGPIAILPNINVTADVTASGKATSQISGNRGSGNLPAGGTTAPPVLASPLRQGEWTVSGTSIEADTTTIQVFRNGVLAGTTTVTGGKWRFNAASPIQGGETVNATATAPAKTESGLSNFVIAVPVPAVITNMPYAAGDSPVRGSLLMTNGTVVSAYRTRGSVDTLLGTVAANGGTWSLAVGGTALAAGDQIWATSDTYPFPDGTGTYTCPGSLCCADCLTEAAIKGPTTTNHADGTLLDAAGNPRYCQIMSMHYGAPGDPEVVAEFRSFLQYQTHAFMECQAVNAFENDGSSGHFLSTNGLVSENPAATSYYFGQDSPFAQASGPYMNPGGSERAYSLGVSSAYHAANVVHLSGQNLPNHGVQDEWMSGYIDGNSSKGKVSYLGGHQYTTTLPLSANGKSQGVRYFLNSLYEAPCTSEAVAAVATTLSGPTLTNQTRLTYTVHYAVTGGYAYNTVITLPLPGGVSFFSASGGGAYSGGTVTWVQGILAPGASGDLTVTVDINADGSYSFTAHQSWTVGTSGLTGDSNTLTTVRDTGPPAPPVITAPANGSSTTDTTPDITGTAEAYSTVTVTINGNPYTTTADGSGDWSYTPSSPLPYGANSIYATATDAAGNTSTASATNTFTIVPAVPVITSVLVPGSTVVTGTSTAPPGSTITVTVDGVPYTTTVQGDGTWSATVPALEVGDSITVTVTANGAMSAAAGPVVISGIPSLLRNDDVTSLATYNPPLIFTKYPGDPSLDGFGPNGIAQIGEGAQQQGNGSSDDDDFYYYEVPSGYIDSDPTVLTDNGRPLVFYQLSCSGGCTVYLAKEAGSIKVTYTP